MEAIRCGPTACRKFNVNAAIFVLMRVAIVSGGTEVDLKVANQQTIDRNKENA